MVIDPYAGLHWTFRGQTFRAKLDADLPETCASGEILGRGQGMSKIAQTQNTQNQCTGCYWMRLSKHGTSTVPIMDPPQANFQAGKKQVCCDLAAGNPAKTAATCKVHVPTQSTVPLAVWHAKASRSCPTAPCSLPV
eukprot:scaffold283_cov316-Pavlova_lutheri.AAC.9